MICPNCDREFEPPFVPRYGSTRLLCRVCFAESRGDLDMAFAEIAWQQGYALGYRRGQLDASHSEQTLISESLVNDALILTHPDRHPQERFTAANSVTARLIALRDAIRRLSRHAPPRVQ